MSTADERQRILKMLEAGTINAEEAAKLLDALEGTATAGARKPVKKMRWLRVRVYEGGSERPSVNVKVPLSLMGIVKHIGGRFLPDSAMDSLEELLDQVSQNPESGKLVEVVDHEDGDRVEILVE